MPTLYYGTLEATLKLVVVKAARKHSVNCYAMPNQLFPAWVLTIWNRTVILKDAKDTATLLKGARLPNITQQSKVVIQKSPNRLCFPCRQTREQALQTLPAGHFLQASKHPHFQTCREERKNNSQSI